MKEMSWGERRRRRRRKRRRRNWRSSHTEIDLLLEGVGLESLGDAQNRLHPVRISSQLHLLQLHSRRKTHILSPRLAPRHKPGHSKLPNSQEGPGPHSPTSSQRVLQQRSWQPGPIGAPRPGGPPPSVWTTSRAGRRGADFEIDLPPIVVCASRRRRVWN